MRPVDDLALSVTEVITLLGPLAALIPEKPNKPKHGPRSKPPTAPAPWNGEAAGLWMEIHAGVRWHEDTLCLLAGLPARHRGGSDQNTVYALERLPILAGAGPDMSYQVGDTIRDVDRWLRQAREILGLADPTHRMPKAPKHDEPACPYCHLYTLRWRGERYTDVKVWCANPTCRDNEGRKPVARARRGTFSGTESMCFQDGTMIPPGLPRTPNQGQERTAG